MTSARSRRGGRPKADYSQASRVLALYIRLLRGERISVEAAAERFGVGPKTLRRDIAVLKSTLSEHGIELVEDKLAKKGYRVEGLRREWGVTAGQVLAVFLGGELARFLSGPEIGMDVAPLLGRLERELGTFDRGRLEAWARRVAVIVPGRFDYRRSAELQLRLKTCLDAMHRQKVVTLSYLSHRRAREGAAARRLRVHLLGLVHYKDGIYFIVDVVDGDLEPDRERRILLALDRMSELDVSEVGFELPADFDARAFFGDAFGIWREGSVQEVKLLVAPGGAPYVEGRILHPRQSVRPQTDGSLIVTFPTQGLREVADWVLSFGEHVEVIEPPELRMAVERRLRQALANYLG